ncbi:hypothetical protein HYY72_00330 [Candidatus Woesearchaeota archaeon]|nr:hypothetical protein [Candidatus Woesearchaeota archaeon]
MVKVVVFKEQYRITLPKDLVKAKGWDSTTELRFLEAPDGTIILREMESERTENKKANKKQKGGSNGKQ